MKLSRAFKMMALPAVYLAMAGYSNVSFSASQIAQQVEAAQETGVAPSTAAIAQLDGNYIMEVRGDDYIDLIEVHFTRLPDVTTSTGWVSTGESKDQLGAPEIATEIKYEVTVVADCAPASLAVESRAGEDAEKTWGSLHIAMFEYKEVNDCNRAYSAARILENVEHYTATLDSLSLQLNNGDIRSLRRGSLHRDEFISSGEGSGTASNSTTKAERKPTKKLKKSDKKAKARSR